ncbi:MAG: DNA polymerase III subunit epsilon, partial [Burkholderiales bacterium]|nr:DNA polymerase III subunit epsilon [Burkholderiales bacterium]
TLLGMPLFPEFVGQITDTLVQAKELHPGKRNSLDSLCDRYEISNSHRKLHGALLDAELLADVFLAMSRGQNSFSIEIQEEEVAPVLTDVLIDLPMHDVLLCLAEESEMTEHELLLTGLDKDVRGKSIWNQI